MTTMRSALVIPGFLVALPAVEYFSSGISGFYKNTVWLDQTADPRLRLVLATAMTSVLELKCQQQRIAPAEE